MTHTSPRPTPASATNPIRERKRSAWIPWIGVLIACLVGSVTALADSVIVGPTGDFQTIQDAINASDPGDSVLVTSGTYFEHIVLDRPVTIAGPDSIPAVFVRPDTDNPMSAPVLTVSDDAHPVFDAHVFGIAFELGDGRDTAGERFGGTILVDGTMPVHFRSCRSDSGNARWGGGLAVLTGATATIQTMSVNLATARQGGGGLYIAGSLDATDLTIASCTADSAGGGGALVPGSITLHSGVVMDNTGAGAGGLALSGTGTLENVSWTGNVGTSGGAIEVALGAMLEATDCTVTGNEASIAGGGLAIMGSATVTGGVIENNEVRAPALTGTGGGVHIGPLANASLIDIDLRRNAAEMGGAVSVASGLAELERLIVADNHATMQGGGILITGAATLDFLTIDSNIAPLGGGIFVSGATPSIRNSILSRNETDDLVCDGATIDFNNRFGNGIIDLLACPLGTNSIVADPRYAGGDPFSYELESRSPCIDAADPAADVPQNGGLRADIGAREFRAGPTILSIEIEGDKRLYTNGDELSLLVTGTADTNLTVTATGDFTNVDTTCNPNNVEITERVVDPPATFGFRASCTLGAAAGVDSNLAVFVTVTTSLGGSTTDSVRVNVDAVAPFSPAVDLLPAGTSTGVVTVSGRASMADSVAVLINDVRMNQHVGGVGTNDRFSIDVTVTERFSTITAVSVDAAGNESNESLPQTVAFTGAFFIEVPKRFVRDDAFVVGAPSESNEVTITIVNLGGQVINVLRQNGGQVTSVPWDGRNADGSSVNAGPYIARIEVQEGSGAQRVEHAAFVYQKGGVSGVAP